MKLDIKVYPQSSRQKIIQADSGIYKVYLNSAPEKGKANKELIKLLASHFGVKKSDVTIEKGETSRTKTVNVNMPDSSKFKNSKIQ